MPALKQFNVKPLYQQVADEFIARIVSRQWVPGQIIENESEIARSLGISIGTVRKAFDVLADYAVLERQQGRGTIVADLSSDNMQSRFCNIVDASGERVLFSTEVSDAEVVSATAEVAQALAVGEDAQVLKFRRLRRYEERPVLSETVYMRFDGGKKSSSADKLMALAEAGWSSTGLATRKQELVSSGKASAEDASRLKVTAGTPILLLARTIYSYEGTPLEYRTAACNLGDKLSYAANL
ncbi:GntR family transcriptional regulator [Aureimonas frigidaquae]|uniref:GntR family transcriptional regulator n=1 Tax=Aureimonas frigidaquae TaxID=424757 RepID=UPI000785C111|nr:GntR family transcriptional regulator [Aureimonas frigidaquae]